VQDHRRVTPFLVLTFRQPARCADPSIRERERTPRRRETLFRSLSCRCSAQASPGLGIAVFLLRSFWRSV